MGVSETFYHMKFTGGLIGEVGKLILKHSKVMENLLRCICLQNYTNFQLVTIMNGVNNTLQIWQLKPGDQVDCSLIGNDILDQLTYVHLQNKNLFLNPQHM